MIITVVFVHLIFANFGSESERISEEKEERMSYVYDSFDAEVENREWVDRINANTRRMRRLSEEGISFKRIEEDPLTLECSFCRKKVIVNFNQTAEESFFFHAQFHLMELDKKQS